MRDYAFMSNRPGADNRPRIMFAMPHTGTMCVNLTFNLLAMMFHPNYRVLWQPLGFRRPVDAARNEIVELFLQSDCEYLLMIDADMSDDPDYLTAPRFLDLASYDKDIIGPIMLMYKDEDVVPIVLVYDEKAEGLKVMKSFILGQVLECDAIGSGVMMIKRRVLEKLEPPYFKYLMDEKTGKLKLGQDFYFCQKAREAGFHVYTHTGIMTTHYQTLDLLPLFKQKVGLVAEPKSAANTIARKIK